MKYKSVSAEVLDKIKESKITPKPRWSFLLKNYIFWLISALSLAVGSLAFAVVIFLVKNNDWDIYMEMSDSLFEFIIVTLPYFWLVFLIIFTAGANYNFKRTKKGYKYEARAIVAASVLASVVLGTLFYNFGAGKAMEETFARKVPLYEKVTRDQRAAWTRPQKGFLAGKIMEIEDKDNFTIKDLKGNDWRIEGAVQALRREVSLKEGMVVRIVGRLAAPDRFRANIILLPRDPAARWLKEELNPAKINEVKLKKLKEKILDQRRKPAPAGNR